MVMYTTFKQKSKRGQTAMPRRQPGQADVHHVCAIWCVHPDRVMGTVLSDQRT